MKIECLNIGKVKRTIRKDPTFIPIKIAPPKKPAEKPIPVPNWPVRQPEKVPNKSN